MSMTSVFSASTLRPHDLVVLGDPCADLYFTANQMPVAGEKCLGKMLGCFSGGSESNVACAASQCGLQVMICGRVGNDLYADMLIDDLSSAGVDLMYLRRLSDTSSACAMVFVQSDGEKALIYSPMSAPWEAEDPVVEQIKFGRAFYSAPYDVTRFLNHSAIARSVGTTVVIDIEAAMAPDSGTYSALLRGADVVFINSESFYQLNGVLPSIETVRPLLDRGPRLVVATLGVNGALAVTSEAACQHQGFPDRAIDATGAGDCFAGAFLSCALKGEELEESMRFACAAASFAVTAMGARTAYPSGKDVDRRLDMASAKVI